jgi:hypothetical protein
MLLVWWLHMCRHGPRAQPADSRHMLHIMQLLRLLQVVATKHLPLLHCLLHAWVLQA